MAALHEVITQILALADELKTSTIDALLAKSDLEVGLEWLSRDDGGS